MEHAIQLQQQYYARLLLTLNVGSVVGGEDGGLEGAGEGRGVGCAYSFEWDENELVKYYKKIKYCCCRCTTLA